MVPIGPLGSESAWPRVTDPVQAPTVNDVALKLPGFNPVASCSWLRVLAKLGNTCVGVTPRTFHKLPPLPKFPELSLTGVRTAMCSVSPLFAVPNAQAVVVPENTGIAEPALHEVVALMSHK